MGSSQKKSNFFKNLLVNFRLTTVINIHQTKDCDKPFLQGIYKISAPGHCPFNNILYSMGPTCGSFIA